MTVDGSDPCLAGGGAMGALMRAHDWRRSPLGPPACWPDPLKTAVSICLNSRFPMVLWWGRELVMLYNDAWRPILGASKHPGGLGQPGIETWPEIWHIIGAQLQGVMDRAEANWSEDLLLVMDRFGYLEEAYFTYSYSPISVADGRVGGVFTAVTETTGRVIGERRLRFLGELAPALAGSRTAEQACANFARMIGPGSPDIGFALLYLRDQAGGSVRLVGTAGIAPDDARLPAVLDAADDDPDRDPWGIGRALRSGAPVLLDDLPATLGELPGGIWPEPATRALTLPIARAGQDAGSAAVLVAGISPRRLLDQGYRNFLSLTAGHLATAIANARAYDEERRRAAALAELDRAKTVFFSNISHEFRTPLALMLGPLEEALAVPPGAPAAQLLQAVDTAHRNSLRLLKLVNTLLDFSRIEAGRLQARFEPLDLAQMVADLASSFRSATDRAGLRLTVDCPALREPVQADRDAIEKIVLNLLSNAFKFTFQGGITVSLRESEDGGSALLSVADTGIGIPAAELPKLFERFHRVEGSSGRSIEGSGIGLALVQEMARLHGGRVTAASAVDRGSIFTVALPFGTAHLPAGQLAPQGTAAGSSAAAVYVEEALRWLPDAPEAGPEPEPEPEAAASADGARILLADDNADMRRYVGRLLRGHGYVVHAVADGEAALAAARRQQPDLLLSDVMMPRLDGIGLLRALRADALLRELPVILLSARAGEEARIEGLESGADDYVTKPFSQRELLARVRANLQLAEMRRQAKAALLRLNEQLARRVEQRTAERDRVWTLSRDLMAISDPDGAIVAVNPAWTDILGWPEAELIGRRSSDLQHNDDVSAIAGQSALRAAGDTVSGFECRMRRKDGGFRWIAWSAVLHDGRIYATGRDVTAQRQAQDELAAANRQLLAQIEERERAESTLRQMQRLEAVGQLTSGVAHDFNNLLTVILGNLDFIARAGPDDPKFARRVEMMRIAGQRGASLTGRLLAFSRQQRLDPKPLDVNAMLSGLEDLLRSTIGGTVRLEIVTEAETSPALADQTQLELVVLNLVINARDAMPDGGRVTVATATAVLDDAAGPQSPASPGPGDYVVISVADTGTGIAPDVLPKVFEPFFTTKDPGKGSGLGLAQVFGFAKQSGGGVRIATGPGQGTTVSVYLPRAETRQGPAAAIQGNPRPRAAAGGERRHILLVDDDRAVREVTRTMLEALGHTVAEAGSGGAALELLDGDPGIDQLLVDFAMPGMNGAEVARQARARRPGLPVLFVTGYADSAALAELSEDEIVFKPFRDGELERKLRLLPAAGADGAAGAAVAHGPD